MKIRIRWLGLVPVLAMCLALVAQAPVFAIPPNAPKIGMICTPGTVSGTMHIFNLGTNTGFMQTPDGNSIFMWSYANNDAPDNGVFQTPGPVLCVTQGQTVVVNLTNNLPEPVSIVFPGQDSQVSAAGGTAGLFTSEAAPGGSVQYSFVASSPGTYLYESGSDTTKQLEMGLYGALIVRPAAGPNFAYDATTQFDPAREFILILSEYDPDLHHAVETGAPYDFNALHNRYFSINGREFPDTVQENGSALLPSQPYGSLIRIQPYSASNTLPALIRMINVGELNHPFHPHGNHTREIAQDGRLLVSPGGGSASTEHFGETIGSGQTQDFLLTWQDPDNWSPTNPLPVAQPNYRNLTFKDNNTWYSGSPYLGYSGTLPTGTNSLNLCGEWYFPLHSHALNEFTNFDEGFGGMGTLLRVDPTGGCFAFPTSTRINAGTLNRGTVSALAADDGNAYWVNSTTTGAARVTDWYAQFSGIQAGSTNFVFTYNGRNCATWNGTTCAATAAKPTALSIWNWNTSAWVALSGGTANIGTSDATITTASIASPTAFIGTGANKGLVRVRVLTGTSTTSFVTGSDFMKIVYSAP